MGEVLRLYDGFRVKTGIFYDEGDLHERQPSLVRTEPIVIVRGDLQHRGGTVNLPAHSFMPLRSSDDVAPAAHNFR